MSGKRSARNNKRRKQARIMKWSACQIPTTISRRVIMKPFHEYVEELTWNEVNVYNQIKADLKLILPNDILYIMYSYLFQFIKIVRNKTNDGDEMRFHYVYHNPTTNSIQVDISSTHLTSNICCLSHI